MYTLSLALVQKVGLVMKMRYCLFIWRVGPLTLTGDGVVLNA